MGSKEKVERNCHGRNNQQKNNEHCHDTFASKSVETMPITDFICNNKN
jgi:hypothetical protein